MPRLSLLDREDLAPEDAKFYDSVQEARGLDPSDRRITMPDVYRIMLRSPDLASRVAGTAVPIRAGKAVSQEVQEIVVLTVSRELMAPLQWGIHVLRGRDEGVRAAVIKGIRDHDVGAMDERERLLVDFASRMVHRRMDDATYAAVSDLLGERALVDLTVLVGFTTMLIQIVEALDIDSLVDVDLLLPPVTEQAQKLWSSQA